MKDGFAPGRTARGRITIPGYEHVTFEAQVERMESERVLRDPDDERAAAGG